MVVRKGTIVARLGSSPEVGENTDLTEDEAAKVLAVEVELNGPIATELYKKHGVHIRVHL